MRARFLALLLLPALAQAGDAELLACARLSEAAARLACYDALAARLVRAPESARSPAPPSAPAAPLTGKATPPAEATFGAQPNEALDALQSQIMGDFEGWGPRTVFTLANGQRWMVVDGSTGVVYLKNPKITIRRGALGSFWFEVQGLNTTARVKRIE